MTTVALLTGVVIAIFNLRDAKSTVNLIIFAQALTVLGLPALAAALLYLGTRRDLVGERKVPGWMISVEMVGFLVALILAVRTSLAIAEKLANSGG